MEEPVNRAPVAALLFEPGAMPTIAAIEEIGLATGGFSVCRPVLDARERAAAAGGAVVGTDAADWVELLRDGLTFDIAGFTAPRLLARDRVAHRVGIADPVTLRGKSALTLAPGPHLAGAANLLPVVRVVAGLLLELLDLPGLAAVVWLPAQLASGPNWFARAVRAWLAGGPFPALALAAIERHEASLTSNGLHFLIGQEFSYVTSAGAVSERDSRIVLRLADWLVAHGRLDSPREVVLAGVGAVWLEPEAEGLIRARAV